MIKAPYPPQILYARIVTGTERNFIRLRVWLARRIYRSLASTSVSRFGPHSVLKSTRVTHASEGANIEYIARHTTIPVPRVQDVFIIDERMYIVMDYIKGCTLTKTTMTLLPVEQLKNIFEELKGYIAQMRALNPPRPGRVEAADGSGVFDPRLRGATYCSTSSCDSIQKFHTRLGHDLVLKSDKYRKACEKAWPQLQAIRNRQYCTKFTHANITPKNILVNNGKIAAIVDWETAGWYPEYWEYAYWAVSNRYSLPRWMEFRDEVLEPYPDEDWVDNYIIERIYCPVYP
jgi:aminoglycoside phosphotransferase